MAKRPFESGDVITADKLNSLLLNLIQMIHAGPGISIKRLGDNMVISALRNGSSGGNSSVGRESHHVVADFGNLSSIEDQEIADIAILTTPDYMAYKYDTADTAWIRVVPFAITTAEAYTTPAFRDGTIWHEQFNELLYICADSVYWPLVHIGPVVNS